MVSIVHDKALIYPDAGDFFSPAVRYPEYRFGLISTKPNRVYDAVRDAFLQAGLDHAHFGTPDWNPLRAYIKPGQNVFLLCNFVQHRRSLETEENFKSKCIHGSVLRAVTDYVLLAAGKGGTVSFGNAPLQSANWNAVLKETGASEVWAFYKTEGWNVAAQDLRLVVAERGILGNPTKKVERDAVRDSIEIDLAANSLLGEMSRNGKSSFRVSEYSPERTEKFHAGTSHRYVINRAILEADVVFSLPKLKTHEKVGITCAIKGFVGTVGHKDCLAHHRFGGPEHGGDEYPHGSRARTALSRFHDYAYSLAQGTFLHRGLVALDTNIRRVIGRARCIQAGAWYGNDTCWRMAVDLARIVHYADKNGVMSDKPQRTHLGLIDGVIAGEGNGPLSPLAAPAGTLIFGDDVVSLDVAACRTMGFDPLCIPMVREAVESRFEYPLTTGGSHSTRVVFNRNEIDLHAVPIALHRSFMPSQGWRGHMGEITK